MCNKDKFSVEYLKEPYTNKVKYALFDFDGTVSLIRQGWQEIMVPYFVEEVSALGTGESEDAIESCVREFVDILTGKETIYQCSVSYD